MGRLVEQDQKVSLVISGLTFLSGMTSVSHVTNVLQQEMQANGI